MRFSIIAVVFCAVLFVVPPVLAQKSPSSAETPAAAPARPERIVRPMIAIDPVTLKGEGVEIRLWGIEPASTSESPLELRALDLLDSLIEGQQVNCKIEGGQLPVFQGRCVVQGVTDLSLELLNNGLAVRDRRVTYNTQFASAYGKAEEMARHSRKGVWKYLADDEKAAAEKTDDASGYALPLALIAGPFAGMVLIGAVLWFWMQNMARAQQADAEAVRRKEQLLQAREKNVLLTTLEGELLENKNKIEAFLAIYGDMLAGLKNPAEQPKYQQVGDIVQKHPSFSKTVFEANVGKLSLLGIKLAGSVSKLYAGLPSAPEYINLEPNVALETAIQLVEKVMKDAETQIPAIESAIAGLQAAAQQKDS